MNQKQPNRRTAQQWQALIDQQRESGVSQKAFCLSRNICLSTFTLWKRKPGGCPRKYLGYKTPYELFKELTGIDPRKVMGYAFMT